MMHPGAKYTRFFKVENASMDNLSAFADAVGHSLWRPGLARKTPFVI